MLFTVIDTETTGTNPENDALIDIAAIDVENGIVSDKPRISFIKPPIPIPPEASAVHHIVDADVAQAPPAREAVPLVLIPDRPAIYVAHKADFEYGFLKSYLPAGSTWLCTWRAALRVYPNAPNHKLQTLRYFLNLPVDRAIADYAHRAMPDAYVAAYLLLDLLTKASVEDMLAWTREPPRLPFCPLNPHRGKPWSQVPVDFLMWIVGLEKQKDRDMDPDIIWNARLELDRLAMAQRAAKQTERDAKNELIETEREAYAKLFKQILANPDTQPKTVADLENWWKGEAESRTKWNIIKGDPLYSELAKACADYKKTIVQQQPAAQTNEQVAA